jgi:glycosyltransferase involved in cell wall biosynthesis
MIVGGAQENTLYTCLDLMRIYGDDVLLVTGPQTGPEGSLLERAKEQGVPLKILPGLRRAIHPLQDVQGYREIKRALREFRPDVVHTHSAKGGILGRLAADALGVPAIVHTVHGAPFYPYQGRGVRAFYQACERYAARHCHALVSVADAMTDLMVNAGVAPREKFTTVYSGMEVEPFLTADEHRAAVRKELGFTDEHVVIGKIARLFHLKGHEYVIRAAQPVIEKFPNVRFLFVGNGILKERLERQIVDEGLTYRTREGGERRAESGKPEKSRESREESREPEKSRETRVESREPEKLSSLRLSTFDSRLSTLSAPRDAHFHFTGLVPPDRIPSLIGAMDVLVHASLREGLARALPQALIAGKPVVSYDIDGAREVVLPGETGYLLPPQCIEPMTDALCELAADAELRRRLGGQGRARFTHQFRHETMTRQLREIYARLLAAH